MYICYVYSVRCLAIILLFKQEMPVIILESERFFIRFYIFPRGLGISRAYLVHITGERLVESTTTFFIAAPNQIFTLRGSLPINRSNDAAHYYYGLPDALPDASRRRACCDYCVG